MELDEEIINSAEPYSIKDAHKYILDNYNIKYSYNQVWEILKKN